MSGQNRPSDDARLTAGHGFGNDSRHYSRRLFLESLECRYLLSADSVPANIDFYLQELTTLNQTAESTFLEPRTTENIKARIISKFGDLLQLDSNARPIIQVWTDGQPESVRSSVEELGGRVIAVSGEHRLIEASVDVSAITSIAKIAGVRSITSVYRPFLHAGRTETQGDQILKSDRVRALGYDGSSALVGAISDSALSIHISQEGGDLPIPVDRYLEVWGTDEGRAMLEIIHDIAPGARLAHHSGAFSELLFANGVRTLAEAGAEVIVDDVLFPDEPFFQDGIIAEAVEEVTSQHGVLYVSAAGNSADLSYESDFVHSNDGWHDFDLTDNVDTRQTITIPAGRWSISVSLQWDQPFYTENGVQTDLDLFVYDAAGNRVASSETRNVTMPKPVEIARWNSENDTPTNFAIGIQHKSGPADVRLKHIVFGPEETEIAEFATDSGTIVGHAAAASAVAVGAVPYFSPTSIEPFSSIGDSTILFDREGNRLPTPDIRSKPDLVAPDNVNTTFFGEDIPEDPDDFPNFTGTSAAAPHVAGVAALLLDVNPHLTRDELYRILVSTAIDLGEAGRDPTYGAGLVDADAARSAASQVMDVTPPLAELVSPMAVHGWTVDELRIHFSEPIEPTIATNPANYLLVEAGTDNAFNTADDVSYDLDARYGGDDRRDVRLTILGPASELDRGDYRLQLSESITDPTNNELDHDTGLMEFSIGWESQIRHLATVDQHGHSRAAEPQLDVRNDGTAVVVYSNHPRLGNIWPQVMVSQFDRGGVPETPFRSVPADLANADVVQTLDIATSDSRHVLTYSTNLQRFRTYYHLLDTSGRTRHKSEVLASLSALEIRTDATASGSFVLAYASPSSSRAKVVGRMFDTQGASITSEEFVVSKYDNTMNLSVGVAVDGTTVFAWTYGSDVPRDGSSFSVFARRYDGFGNPLGDEFRVNTITKGSQWQPEVALSDTGRFAIVWQNSSSGAADGVRLQLFDEDGIRVGEEVHIHPSGRSPQIAMTHDGRYAVAWESSGGIFLQRFSSDGSPYKLPIWVSEGQTGHVPRLAMTEQGDMVVFWKTGEVGGALRWVRWNAPGEEMPYGPWVQALSPVSVLGPVDELSISFDRSMNPATLNVSDVEVMDPTGQPVTVREVRQVDDKTFIIEIAPQTTPGEYSITVGPDVEDVDGNRLDANADTVAGDAFVGTFHVLAQPTVPTFSEDFEAGAIHSLGAYWEFGHSGTGEVLVTSDAAPRGNHHLALLQNAPGFSVTEAILHLDLVNGSTTARGVRLDFWQKWIPPSNGSSSALNGLVHVRPDRFSEWTPIDRLETTATHTLFELDLDAVTTDVRYTEDFQIRFSVQGNAFYRNRGFALDDIRVTATGIDYGDAPASYPTKGANNGAHHIIVASGPFLGNTVDGEYDGQPDPNSLGDDNDGGNDEDGVTFSLLERGKSSQVDIDVTSSSVNGYLNAWIDFNADGDWEDAGEKIFSDVLVERAAVRTFAVDIPEEAVPGETFARFRISSKQGVSYDGLVEDGEVEDYKVTIGDPALRVTSLIPSSTGFVAEFNSGLDPTTLNLYDTQSAGLGPPDILLQGQRSGRVAGSLVVDAAARRVTFIKSGDPLAADTYTVTLRSAENGFKRADGALLDGDGDGTPGGDFTETFTVTPSADSAVTVSLPDFVRGPGQDVNVSADTTTGIPLLISEGANLRSATLAIDYNPAMLTITGATAGSAIPTGATVTLDTATAGTAILTFTSPAALPAGSNVLVNLQASVPMADAGAIYGQQQVLDVHSAQLSDANANPIPAIADDALHLAAYFADVSGNGRINASDASQVARFAALLETGFAGSVLTDPIIVGDISGNGRINAADASLLAQFAALIPVLEIPPIPVGVVVADGEGFGALHLVRPPQDPLEETGNHLEEPSPAISGRDTLPDYYPAIDTVLTVLAEPAGGAADEEVPMALEEVVDHLLALDLSPSLFKVYQ